MSIKRQTYEVPAYVIEAGEAYLIIHLLPKALRYRLTGDI